MPGAAAGSSSGSSGSVGLPLPAGTKPVLRGLRSRVRGSGPACPARARFPVPSRYPRIGLCACCPPLPPPPPPPCIPTTRGSCLPWGTAEGLARVDQVQVGQGPLPPPQVLQRTEADKTCPSMWRGGGRAETLLWEGLGTAKSSQGSRRGRLLHRPTLPRMGANSLLPSWRPPGTHLPSPACQSAARSARAAASTGVQDSVKQLVKDSEMPSQQHCRQMQCASPHAYACAPADMSVSSHNHRPRPPNVPVGTCLNEPRTHPHPPLHLPLYPAAPHPPAPSTPALHPPAPGTCGAA